MALEKLKLLPEEGKAVIEMMEMEEVQKLIKEKSDKDKDGLLDVLRTSFGVSVRGDDRRTRFCACHVHSLTLSRTHRCTV